MSQDTLPPFLQLSNKTMALNYHKLSYLTLYSAVGGTLSAVFVTETGREFGPIDVPIDADTITRLPDAFILVDWPSVSDPGFDLSGTEVDHFQYMRIATAPADMYYNWTNGLKTPDITDFQGTQGDVLGPFELAASESNSGVDSRPFTVNLEGAVRRLKRGVIARVGNGGGGVDIVCIGDSLTRGLNDPTHFRTGWVHRLKVRLQDKFNPPGVPGGYGFIRTWDTVGGSRNDAAMTLNGATANSTGGTSLTFARLAQNAVARTNRICFQFNGAHASASAFRWKVTDIEFLMHASTGGTATTADGRLDISLGAAPGLAAGGVFTQNVDTSALAGLVPGYRVRATGLDRDANLFAQFGNGVTTPGSLNDFWTEGYIAYDGDWTDGIRVHNFGAPGVASTSFTSAQELTANVVRFCTGATSGARNGKLFVIALQTNDYRTGVPAATHLANLTTIVDRILSQPTQPGVVILLLPLAADGAAGWLASAGGTASVVPLRNAAYDLANSREGVGLIDLHDYAGGGYWYVNAGSNVYVSNLSALGWNEADLIHLSASAQADISDILYTEIMRSYEAVAA